MIYIIIDRLKKWDTQTYLGIFDTSVSTANCIVSAFCMLIYSPITLPRTRTKSMSVWFPSKPWPMKGGIYRIY